MTHQNQNPGFSTFRGIPKYMSMVFQEEEISIIKSGCCILYNLKKGKNTFLIKGGRPGLINIKLLPVEKPVFFTQRDMTQPDLLTSENDDKWAAIRILNTTSKTLKNLRVISEVNALKESQSFLPSFQTQAEKCLIRSMMR